MPRAPTGFVPLTLLVQGSGSTVPVRGSRFPVLVQRSQRGRVKGRANSRFHDTASGSRPPENLESAPAQIVTTSRTEEQRVPRALDQPSSCSCRELRQDLCPSRCWFRVRVQRFRFEVPGSRFWFSVLNVAALRAARIRGSTIRRQARARRRTSSPLRPRSSQRRERKSREYRER